MFAIVDLRGRMILGSSRAALSNQALSQRCSSALRRVSRPEPALRKLPACRQYQRPLQVVAFGANNTLSVQQGASTATAGPLTHS
jgi:hypothetical protein